MKLTDLQVDMLREFAKHGEAGPIAGRSRYVTMRALERRRLMRSTSYGMFKITDEGRIALLEAELRSEPKSPSRAQRPAQ